MKVTERVSVLTAADIGAVSGDDLNYLGGTAPTGGITIWSGTEEDIPLGWSLCNGDNGTPDMRGMFVISTTDNSEIGTTGGEAVQEIQAMTTVSGVASDTTLTIANLPSHTHSGPMKFFEAKDRESNKNVPGFSSTIGAMTPSGYTGGSDPHGHSYTTDVYSAPTDVSAMPPYLALAFIMYTGVVI